MKKIPIKFRGRFWLKGLEPSDINTRLNDGDFIIKNDGAAFLVYHDSVAQLVGYDADGKEIYEGDKVFDADNNAVIAALYPNAHYKNYTLKRK